MAEPMPEILAVLGARTATVVELLAHFDLPDDAETRALLTERLTELEAVGLVWRV